MQAVKPQETAGKSSLVHEQICGRPGQICLLCCLPFRPVLDQEPIPVIQASQHTPSSRCMLLLLRIAFPCEYDLHRIDIEGSPEVHRKPRTAVRRFRLPAGRLLLIDYMAREIASLGRGSCHCLPIAQQHPVRIRRRIPFQFYSFIYPVPESRIAAILHSFSPSSPISCVHTLTRCVLLSHAFPSMSTEKNLRKVSGSPVSFY